LNSSFFTGCFRFILDFVEKQGRAECVVIASKL